MSSKLLFLILIIAVFTRFWGINWGNSFYFQPDENNMATALSQFSPTNLNPHFFAYGQFPLYLGYYSLRLFHFDNNFSAAILILRFWSAIFSLAALVVFYLIYPSLIFLWLLIFNPGLIQLAHFGTTESLLILVFAVNLYLSKLILKSPSTKIYSLLAGISTGVGLASKISALIFLAPIYIAILFSLKKYKNVFYPFFYSSFSILVSCFFFLILSPYNLLAKNDFLTTMAYETHIATGVIKVFYTQQFQTTIPYLFQFINIFPYVSGLSVFVLAFFGLFRKPTKYSLVVISSCLIYFLYFGQLYVKWARFMSPVFFVFPLLATIFISKLTKPLKIFLLLICLLPGILFMRLYFSPDIRVQATVWTQQFIPRDAVVLSEAGNVDNVPPATIFFDFYNIDTNLLFTDLATADYIIIPSRRVFKNNFYSIYYQQLFSGKLGFTLVKQFSPVTDLILNPENAEETWSVFDRPTIRIYKKVKSLSPANYEVLLQS